MNEPKHEPKEVMTQAQAKKKGLEFYLDKFGFVCHVSTKVLNCASEEPQKGE